MTSDIFDEIEEKSQEGDIFDQVEEEIANPERPSEKDENWYSNTYQVIGGLLKRFTWPLDIVQASMIGDALSDIEELEMAAWKQGKEFDVEKYKNYLAEQIQTIPTQENIESFIEEKTGLPLTPRGKGKDIRFASQIFGLTPGGLTGKTTAAITGAGTRYAAQEAGVPEIGADILGGVASQLPRAASSAVRRALPKTRESKLAQSLIGEDLARSQYETAEELANRLKNLPPDDPPPPPSGWKKTELEFADPTQRTPRTTERRVTTGGEALPLRPTTPARPTTEETVGRLFAPQRFRNSTEAGREIKNNIMARDREVYEQVGQLYRNSRNLNREVVTTHEQLYQDLGNIINEIDQVAHPSGVQNQVRAAARDIRRSLAEEVPIRDAEGNIIDYDIIFNEVSSQPLIDQVQSLRQKIDYDFQHGNVKNIFNPLINSIENSVERAAASTGNQAASQAWQEARSAYRNWAETFDNDYVRPFRDRSNRSFQELYKQSLKSDNANVLRPILQETEGGRNLERQLVRSIVEKDLKPFLDDPWKMNPREFNRALEELEPLTTAQERSALRGVYAMERQAAPFRGRKIQAPTPQEKVLGKITDRKPEQIFQMMNSRTGIKQLRQEVANDPIAKNQFNQLTKQRIRSILQEGKIEGKFTGTKLYEVLNNESNYEIISEIIGKEATQEVFEAAKKIGNQQMTLENIKKIGKYTGALKFIQYISPLL